MHACTCTLQTNQCTPIPTHVYTYVRIHPHTTTKPPTTQGTYVMNASVKWINSCPSPCQFKTAPLQDGLQDTRRILFSSCLYLLPGGPLGRSIPDCIIPNHGEWWGQRWHHTLGRLDAGRGRIDQLQNLIWKVKIRMQLRQTGTGNAIKSTEYRIVA